MTDRRMSALVAGLGVFVICAVLWDVFYTPSHSRRAVTTVAGAHPDSVAPSPSPSPGLRADSVPRVVAPPPPPSPGDQLSYFDQLARAETRRRLRASAGYTYLSEVVAESEDSALHRWDDRATRAVRVYLPTGTAANFQPTFLEAVRSAFDRWAEVGVPVRFDVGADSEHAEVRFRWKEQFEIDRTAQTDLRGERGGRMDSRVRTRPHSKL